MSPLSAEVPVESTTSATLYFGAFNVTTSRLSGRRVAYLGTTVRPTAWSAAAPRRLTEKTSRRGYVFGNAPIAGVSQRRAQFRVVPNSEDLNPSICLPPPPTVDIRQQRSRLPHA